MIKLLKKYLKIYDVDIYIYGIDKEFLLDYSNLIYTEKRIPNKHGMFDVILYEDGKIIHKSSVFKKLNVLRLIGKKGCGIGDCYTSPEKRGLGIYPSMLSKLTSELLKDNKNNEVFIIVDGFNTVSMKGIEKAGYKKMAHIISKKFLIFYFNTTIHKFQ